MQEMSNQMKSENQEILKKYKEIIDKSQSQLVEKLKLE